MKSVSLSFLLALIFTIHVSAGGGTWPGIKYSYAKVYVYNVDGNLRGNHQILKNGKLDTTVQGEGKTLTKEQTAQFEKIFASGPAIDELLVGLSGCYIPRHAIVYYDSKDVPVASMSICFECEGIRFYSPSYPRNHYASSPKLVEKAQKLLGEMRAIIESHGIKTEFKVSDLNPDNKPDAGKMYITDSSLVEKLLNQKITLENYQKLCLKDTVGIQIKKDEKYTHGGDKYIFVNVYKGKSHLFFSGPDEGGTLESAEIVSNDVQISDSIKIGMTRDEIQSLVVYDGISNPEEITFQNPNESKKIIFHFTNGILDKYSVLVRYW